MKPVIILGTGGHAKVVLELALLSGLQIKGFSVPELGINKASGEFPVIGTDEDVLQLDPTSCYLVNGLGSVSSLERRYDVYNKFSERGFSFLTLTHPSAIVSNNARLGEGVQIMAGAVVQTGTTVGCNTIINTKASVDHDCSIGAHVHIAPGVTISGGVKIEKCVHIGTSAVIIQGLTIGEGALVGAGSLILRNVKPRQKVFGVPARVVKNMRDWRKILVKPECTVREVIEIIDRESLQIALVVDERLYLFGTVTDGDVRRALLANIDLNEPVSKIMNSKPIVLKEKARQDHILRVMRENSIHQIPILDSQGRVVDLELLENSLL
ncbi:MAG: hypothetical protein GQF41_0494 [Candidatus Rifleibacterium amylolyticum]|nr:MAG: hypothetical protein GQF41_0494 [Candidatus Rifleibacterium amylolyticum]